MKQLKRTGIYKNSTGSNTFDPKKMESRSYGWWIYFKNINGRNVFNNYFYSSSTSKHQRDMRGLLDQLNIKIDLVVQARNGLQDLETAISDYTRKIINLRELINKKGTKKAKNAERMETILELQNKIYEINKLVNKAVA